MVFITNLENKLDTAGFLCFLKTAVMSQVSSNANDIKGMLIQRNVIAANMIDQTNLPPVESNSNLCNKCFMNSVCTLYHKAFEQGTGDSFGVPALFNSKTSHLTQSQVDFFYKWESLLSVEEGDLNKFKKEIWTMKSTEREALGKCFANMQLVEIVTNTN